MGDNFNNAIINFEEHLGSTNVITDSKTLATYERNVGEVKRNILGVLYPKTTEEVQSVVKIANEFSVPVYPISTGKNWGMGSRAPVTNNCVVVDLARMNNIRTFDNRHGYITVEPGVTQDQLYRYLQEQEEQKWIFGTTGSGKDSSIIGNALEKGGDYFGCRSERMSKYEIVFGNGKIVKTGFSHYPDAINADNFKLGIGPSLDGLLLQSNFGIVTAATLELVPKHEIHCAFKCSIYDEKYFPELVDRFSNLRRLGVITTAAHIANQHRTANTLAPAIYDYLVKKEVNPSKELRKRANEMVNKLASPWSIGGGLMGTKGQVKSAQKEISKAMKGIGKVEFMTEEKLDLAKTLIKYLDFIPQIKKLEPMVYAIEPVLEIITKGKPSDLALATVYWPLETPPAEMNPDQSKCGLLFCLPMIPNDGKSASLVAKKTEDIFAKYGFIPYITMNMLTNTGLEGVINMAFDRTNPEAVDRAHECNRELNNTLIKEGIYPYRLGIELMSLVTNKNDTFWQTTSELKKVLDPNNIIAPGRYNLV